MNITTLAGGCFWCTEAIFNRLKGVKTVIPGYAGGKTTNPSYEEVCTGKTGHAEAIQIAFDPRVISYEKLLEVFWKLHDPTTLNRQGADMGTQYRSAIFYHNEGQKAIAEKSKQAAQKSFKEPIVTEIVSFTNFYQAEDYHKEFYENNPNQPYCRVVIDPKIHKLYKDFKDELK